MKIAMTHVNLPNQSKGGVAYQVHYLANALAERGNDVTLFTFSPACSDSRYHLHSYAAPPPGLRRFQSFFFAARLARTDFSAFDVLHSHGDNYLLGRTHPQIRTFHGSARDEAAVAVTLRRRLYQRVMIGFEAAGARVADVSVGVSEATRARIPRISVVVPNGVSATTFHPGPKSGVPSLLFVGTTGGRKRGAFLAEVFRREIRPRFPQAEFWSVAECPLEGEGIVNFGKVPLDTLADLYRRAWTFCLPSTYEGFGIPYVEAMASGTAVVASPNPGAKEVLANGAFGLLAGDAELGNAINRLLGDEALRGAMAAKGVLQARNYHWDQVAAQYEALYRAVVERHAAKTPRRARLQTRRDTGR